MDVCVTHTASGRSCVVGVGDTDTVLDLKTRALEEMFADLPDSFSEWARRVAARVVGSDGDATAELSESARLCDTPLHAGASLHLAPRGPAVRAPAEYFYSSSMYVKHIALSPCGMLCCVVTAEGRVFLFDTTTAQRLAQLATAMTNACVSAAFSRCGSWLGVQTADIDIYDMPTRSLMRTLRDRRNRTSGIAWTHCGRLVCGGHIPTLRVWDAEQGVIIATLEGHTKYVRSIAVSRDSIFSASEDGTIRIWDVLRLSCSRTLDAGAAGHTRSMHHIALAEHDLRLVSCYDNTLKIWDAAAGLCLHTIVLTPQWVRCIAASDEGGSVAVLSRDREAATVYSISTGRIVGTVDGLKWTAAIAFSSCGRWMFTAHYAVVRVDEVCDVLDSVGA